MNIESNITSQIYNNLLYKPTDDQRLLVELFSYFVTNSVSGDIFLVKGYAGTGKTSVISAIAKSFKDFNIKFVLLAPTGRAAKVMAQYSKETAFTIHKKIYRQKSILNNKFVLDRNLNKDTFFIIDEASMISTYSPDSTFGSGNILADIIEYVNSGQGCRLIICGDHAQLPPVGQSQSPALDKWSIGGYGKIYETELSQVVRQNKLSAILENATLVRELIETKNIIFPLLKTDKTEFIAITGNEFIEEVENAYYTYGKDQTLIVTRSNKQALRFNQAIRQRVLCLEEELSGGDKIMVVKNNYHYSSAEDTGMEFIANGDIASVVRVRKYEEIYDMRFVTAILRFGDYNDVEIECKIILDTLYSESPALNEEKYKQLFFNVEKDYMDIKDKRKRYNAIKEDPYYNALQIKFAYAVTCHKAQGGQWDCVFIDKMIFGQEQMSIELLRWLYTAITRATKKIYVINFDERFGIEKDTW